MGNRCWVPGKGNWPLVCSVQTGSGGPPIQLVPMALPPQLKQNLSFRLRLLWGDGELSPLSIALNGTVLS
jgi:hypothetical protein